MADHDDGGVGDGGWRRGHEREGRVELGNGPGRLWPCPAWHAMGRAWHSPVLRAVPGFGFAARGPGTARPVLGPCQHGTSSRAWHGPALIAAAVSFFLVSLLLSLILLLFCHRTRKSSLHSLASPAPALPLRRLPSASVAADESASFDPSLDHISLNKLATATEGFAADSIIGDGSFRFVYKARLSFGATAAIKHLSTDAFHGFREFHA